MDIVKTILDLNDREREAARKEWDKIREAGDLSRNVERRRKKAHLLVKKLGLGGFWRGIYAAENEIYKALEKEDDDARVARL